jgi:hypothetical protein
MGIGGDEAPGGEIYYRPTGVATSMDTDDPPAYAAYLAADEEVSLTYADSTALGRAEHLGEGLSGAQEALAETPALALSASAVGLAAVGSGLPLHRFGLGGLVTDGEYETTIEEVLIVEQALVLRGDIEAAELSEAVQTTSGGGPLEIAFEPDGEYRGYALYAPAESDPTGSVSIGDAPVEAMAVGETDVVVSDRATAERVIDLASGDGERATEAYEPLAWLLSTVGDAHAAVGGYGPDGFELEGAEKFFPESTAPVRSANGYVAALTFENGTVESEIAAVFGEPISDEKRDDLAGLAGADALDQSLTVEDERAVLTATYDADLVVE